ncbi:unnamed protein product [Adineta steineri]|uniref:Microbial-type PARG catalytic domain-containing protein n=2 Tax=Adineta steineri TaxID=433720 RepID=A0A819J5V7_9BILA|nr:unnamed protein product [Adineta steineri]
MASNDDDTLVYVTDIPSSIPEKDVEQMLQNRAESIGRMKISNVKCYSKLGIAVMQLMNKDDKIYLVDSVQSTILDRQHRISVSFVNELQLDSYVVIDRNLSKIPSSEQIISRFKQAFKISANPVCEPISDQFPNIFRITLNTLDDLAKVANSPQFQIEKSIANVYVCVDCSFFSDLPLFTNDTKLLSAVVAQIGGKELPETSLYVQCNQNTGNAVVLVTKSATTWTSVTFLTIDGRSVPKKTKLPYQVLVSNVPRDFSIDHIIKHSLFTNRVLAQKHVSDQLIVELNNEESYRNCLDGGHVGIGAIVMEIKPYSIVIDPETMDIRAENWYETDMLKIEPDIMTLFHNYQHPIFHYQWNAQNWIEQFQKLDLTEQRSKGYDLHRHLLRVTVMLNTIGTLRKQRYMVNHEEVILKPDLLHSIVYDHKSKLSYGTKTSVSNIKTPYASTSVKVVNEDCLTLYQKLVSEGRRPLLLNMANQANPGGGYRKGDGAQEENLFRRSNYYQSLDVEIADKDRSERMHCNDKCEQKQLSKNDSLYPMDDFGAIYTKGITVFRQTESNGYAYMKTPLYNVCAIAMAAYKDPKLKNNRTLENKFAVRTRKKIENIFAIAHYHKHDCLVLSALGCGAFKNPPGHIAAIFKSVILQYAGFFNTIYFAIVDDHNTGNKINPQGNFLPFQELLDGFMVPSPTILRINAAIGPNRILDKSTDQLILGDVCILDLPPCQHSSKCRDYRKPEHAAQYSHPPMCPLLNATSSCERLDDDVHTFNFIHNIKCKFGGECNDIDPIHLLDFDHPEFCIQGGGCTNISQKHLIAYRHLPNCLDGLKCSKYRRRDQEHLKSFRHCKSVCPYDNCCANIHNKAHFDTTIHSFRPPCPLTPYNCSKYIEFVQSKNSIVSTEIEDHCLEYSHICPYGRDCKTKEENHLEISIHIARRLCPDGNKCSKLTQEDHLESYTHHDIRDIRFLCKIPGFKCRDRLNENHFKIYRHNKNHDHFSVAPSSNLNTSINFARNQGQLIKTVNNYVERMNWEKTSISPEIRNWIRALQPVHRCRKDIFESILVLGHVMSRRFMDLLRKPEHVVRAVQQHSRVRLIFLHHNTPNVKDNVCKLIEILVEAEFIKAKSDGKTSLDSDYGYKIQRIEQKLQPPLNPRDIQVIHEWSVKIAQASIKLNANPMGIKYGVDEKLGTDQHVFSILGPHLGFYYGDIVITFKQEIMFHPDANFSIQAGTSFHSKTTYSHRPWTRDPGTDDKRIEHFHSSKLHCSVHGYEYAAASELTAVTGADRESMNVNLEAILGRWTSVDSHQTFEAHLPQLIPLDYIDRVYIPKNVFESLSPEAQQSAKGAFKDSLMISIYESDETELDATLKEILGLPYPKYVFEQLCEAIRDRMNKPNISHGIVITVAASEFEEHVVLPTTISQAYYLYNLGKPQSQRGLEFTYIYWQAMDGNMMLTVANEKLIPGEQQFDLRCVVCYIAEKPSTVTEEYREAFSYLNDGLPFQHGNNVTTNRFKAKSNTFYRGCNTDDYFTFCLKISHMTGQVTFSHAGPNSIYNHEKIECQFNTSEFDLSKLEFIHLSAGSQDVPVRNLTISFESIPELHPSVDMNFKKDTSNLLEKYLVTPSYVDQNALNNNGTGGGRPMQVIRPSQLNGPSVLDRVTNIFLCRHSNAIEPASLSDNALPTLKPCKDSIYCLQQHSSKHKKQYSHPCGYSELCIRKAKEPYLTHERHNALKCAQDRNCLEKHDPIHRATYRHTNLPDYLIPCRKQTNCPDQSSKHRIKYFHGENLPLIRRKS